MFGMINFKPWVGSQYGRRFPKIMVIGESRYDKEYTDHQIVDEGVGGRAHTKFLQAILGRHHTDPLYDPNAFWEAAIFYNYNTNFFPGRPRIHLDKKVRNAKPNKIVLRKMLAKYRPSHCVVWGVGNWSSIEVDGHEWGPERQVPHLAYSHTYCTIDIEGQRILFSYVKHPSCGFPRDRWTMILSAFLEMNTEAANNAF